MYFYTKIIYIITIILFFNIITNKNVAYCEEIPIELLTNLKKNLAYNLHEFVKHEFFIKEYSCGPIFYLIYFKYYDITQKFIDNLPLVEILNSNKFKSAEEITNYIIDLLIKEIDLNKKHYKNNIFLISSLFYPIPTYINDIATFYIKLTEINSYGNSLNFNSMTAGIRLASPMEILHAVYNNTTTLGLYLTLEGYSNSITISFSFFVKIYNLPIYYFSTPKDIIIT